MPSKEDSLGVFVPSVDDAPLFFCALKDITDNSKPRPWPPTKRLHIKYLRGENCPHKVVDDAIKSAADLIIGAAGGLSKQWVEDEKEADIRISFRQNEPNWSILGCDANDTDAKDATMNFNFGDWGKDKVIYSLDDINRAARHMFGHAVGL